MLYKKLNPYIIIVAIYNFILRIFYIQTAKIIINRRACAAKVRVVGLCMYVCPL